MFALEILDFLLNNLVFSLRLPNIISFSYQRMLILLTCEEPKNTFFDTVSWVKIFVEGRGEPGLNQTNKAETVCIR